MSTNHNPGDILYVKEENQYHICKVLAIDTAFEIYHVLSYAPVEHVPTLTDVAQAELMMMHTPMYSGSFADAVVLSHTPVLSNELIGYHTYLQHTQAPKDYIPIAIGYYKEAFALTDEKRHTEAIDAYSKAIDLFPPFFEAIDNRAFCKMDMGLWQEAIEDFRLSLATQPGTYLAEFSIGECYFKMEDYANAKIQFQIAEAISPGQEMTAMYLARVNLLLGGV